MDKIHNRNDCNAITIITDIITNLSWKNASSVDFVFINKFSMNEKYFVFKILSWKQIEIVMNGKPTSVWSEFRSNSANRDRKTNETRNK